MTPSDATLQGGEPPAAPRTGPTAMDHPFIDDHQMIERYVLGRLSDAEVEAFELHYLECPACLEQLEATERLRAGLGGVAAEEVATRLGVLAVVSRWRRSWAPWALLLIVLVPAAILWRSLGPAPPSGSVALLHLSPVRAPGAVPDVHLDLATAPAWIVLALDLADAPPGPYRAELTSADGTPRWTGASLAADGGGVLALALPATVFTRGDHRLTITPDRGGTASVSFLLRVTRTP